MKTVWSPNMWIVRPRMSKDSTKGQCLASSEWCFGGLIALQSGCHGHRLHLAVLRLVRWFMASRWCVPASMYLATHGAIKCGHVEYEILPTDVRRTQTEAGLVFQALSWACGSMYRMWPWSWSGCLRRQQGRATRIATASLLCIPPAPSSPGAVAGWRRDSPQRGWSRGCSGLFWLGLFWTKWLCCFHTDYGASLPMIEVLNQSSAEAKKFIGVVCRAWLVAVWLFGSIAGVGFFAVRALCCLPRPCWES